MAPSKRPAQSAPGSAPAMKRGRPAKNSVEESSIAREAAEITSENTSPFRRDAVDRYVGELVRVPENGWSQAHEDAMDRMWRESEHSKAVVKMIEAARANKGRTTQPHLLTLFKVSLRVFEMSPIRFLSFSHQLEYLGERGSSATFSKAFSQALTGLIVHPAFNRKTEILSIVIQYAVICRIDDRRPWPNTASAPSCPALTKMIQVMNESDAGRSDNSIHRTHIYARRECEREESTPSKLSDLLLAVGETVKRSGTKGPAVTEDMLEYGGQVVRPVSLYDLKNIIKTLDETTWPDESWNCTVAEALYSYQLVTNEHEVPNGEELPAYYERAHKKKLRDWMLESGFEPQQSADEELSLGGIEQGPDDGERQSPSADPPCNPDSPRTPQPPLSVHRTFPVRTMAEAAVQQPDLIPERVNPCVNAGQRQGVTSPSKSELLARIEVLDKEVAILKAEKDNRKDNSVSHEAAGREPSDPLADYQFNPHLLDVPQLSSRRERGQSEDRQSLLENRSDSPMNSYHGMDSHNDEPASPDHPSVREKSDDRQAPKHTSHQGSVPRQSPREKSPAEEGVLQDAGETCDKSSLVPDDPGDFRHSQYFTNGVKDGSIVDTGIPRSKVQRQQLNDVFTAKTLITGVGCLKSRSDNVARRTEPLYKLAYVDKVKLLLD